MFFFPILLVATFFGGGYALKKALDKTSGVDPVAPMPPPGGPQNAITSRLFDEFLEIRSDGLLQFNRQTAISILGWLGSVSARPTADGSTPFVVVYDLRPSMDGSPPDADSIASRTLIDTAKKGFAILARKDITVVGRHPRRAAAVKLEDRAALQKMAGQGGEYAVLLMPMEELIEPTLPALPGFTASDPDDFPGHIPFQTSPISSLPLDMRRQIDDLLKKTDASVSSVEKLARQLRLGGYVKEAELLDERAADLRALEIASLGAREMFVIPEKHAGALDLCKRMTGDETRIVELLAHNPVLSATVQNGEQISVFPWTPGQIVRIPPSWGSVKG